MDTISLLGPLPHGKQQINQDEFDNRYNYVNRKENQHCLGPFKWMKSKVNEKKCGKREISDFFPSFKWISKYTLKTDLPRDLLGSFLMSALFLPQGLGNGFLALNDPLIGLYSIFLPQLLYVLFGSARHSSIGSFSFVSLMIYSSIFYSQSSPSTLTLMCAVFHLLLFLFHFEWILCLVPDFLLNGVAIGMLIRLLFSQIPHLFVFTDPSCNQFDWCLSSALGCLTSLHVWTLILAMFSIVFIGLFHYVINPFTVNKFQFSLPHELLLILVGILFSYSFNFQANGIRLFQQTVAYKPPTIGIPSLFSHFSDSLIDSCSIALFIVTSHLKISKAIAMEKMQKIDRRQELIAFSFFEFPMSFGGFLPVGTSYGLSQMNVESARFSLMSNVLSCIWLIIFIVFCLPILQYLPVVVLSCIIISAFPGVPSEIVHLQRMWRISKPDCCVFLLGAIAIIIVPNICRGFLVAVAIALLSVVYRVQWPHREALTRLDGEGRFAEETRYEGEPCEAPARIVRFNAPIIFTNVDRLRNEVKRQCKLIKGQVPLGIGTRTGSLRSQIEVRLSAPLEAKLSLAQSKTNLTNFVINDPQVNLHIDQTVIRCLIIDFSSISAVDTHGMHMLNQLYFELQEENIKLLFAAVSAHIRDSMECAGLFSLLPRNSFYPTLNDALLATRAMILPIHTSASLNGCRDIIALSTYASNIDVTQCGMKDSDSKGEPAAV